MEFHNIELKKASDNFTFSPSPFHNSHTSLLCYFYRIAFAWVLSGTENDY